MGPDQNTSSCFIWSAVGRSSSNLGLYKCTAYIFQTNYKRRGSFVQTQSYQTKATALSKPLNSSIIKIHFYGAGVYIMKSTRQ